MMDENIWICLASIEKRVVLKNCLESILYNDLEIKVRKKE